MFCVFVISIDLQEQATKLRESGVPNCGFDEVSRVSEVAMSMDRPAKLSLPGDFHVRRREGVLFLEGPQP